MLLLRHLKVLEFVSVVLKKSSFITLLSIKLTKSKIKKVSFLKLLENFIPNVNYYWLVLHCKIICINFGAYLTFYYLKFSPIHKCSIIGLILSWHKKPKKHSNKSKKEMYTWSVNYIKYLSLSCWEEPNFKYKKHYPLKSKYTFLLVLLICSLKFIKTYFKIETPRIKIKNII